MKKVKLFLSGIIIAMGLLSGMAKADIQGTNSAGENSCTPCPDGWTCMSDADAWDACCPNGTTSYDKDGMLWCKGGCYADSDCDSPKVCENNLCQCPVNCGSYCCGTGYECGPNGMCEIPPPSKP